MKIAPYYRQIKMINQEMRDCFWFNYFLSEFQVCSADTLLGMHWFTVVPLWWVSCNKSKCTKRGFVLYHGYTCLENTGACKIPVNVPTWCSVLCRTASRASQVSEKPVRWLTCHLPAAPWAQSDSQLPVSAKKKMCQQYVCICASADKVAPEGVSKSCW